MEVKASNHQRLRVSLPGRDNQLVTWEELAELEKTHGVPKVREWMKGGKLVYPEEPEEPKSKEFLKHMENLRRRQEQREYARMMESSMPKGSYLTHSISPEHTGVGASGFQLAVVGLNMVIGVGCAFVGADYLGRTYGLSPVQRVAVSLASMIFVMFLEMILFIIRANRFDTIDKWRRQRYEGNFAQATGLGLDLGRSHGTTPGDKKTN